MTDWSKTSVLDQLEMSQPVDFGGACLPIIAGAAAVRVCFATVLRLGLFLAFRVDVFWRKNRSTRAGICLARLLLLGCVESVSIRTVVRVAMDNFR